MNTSTNIIVVVILVLLVGFGVWYFTTQQDPQPQEGGIEINVGADSGESQGY